MMNVSIVIPTFNEEKIIESTILVILEYLQKLEVNFEILVTDDGSTDNTRSLVEEKFHDNPKVLVLSNPHKGKGYAIRKGVEASKFELIYLCDADLSTPIDVLQILINKLNEGYDIVIASREGQNAIRIGEPIYRHFMGRGFNLLTKVVLGLGISDTQCGFKLFKSNVAKKLFSKQILYSDNSREISQPAVTAYDVEILFLAKKYGYKLAEYPVSWEFRENTRVNALRDSIRNFSDVLKVRINSINGRYDNK